MTCDTMPDIIILWCPDGLSWPGREALHRRMSSYASAYSAICACAAHFQDSTALPLCLSPALATLLEICIKQE